MILVATEIGPSKIAGTGLFAAEIIKQGQPWWRFTPPLDRSFTEEEVAALPEVSLKFFKRYAYLQNGIWILCGDHGIFTNHSDQPNSVAVANESVARRDIQKGEEITENYRDFYDDWRDLPFLIPTSKTPRRANDL